MRTLTWALTAVAAGWLQWNIGTARADDSFPPCWRGRTGTTFQNWSLSASNNPATPEQFTNSNGTPQATFTLGSFGRGWLATGLGTKTGLWTLGRGGQVSMSIPNFGGAAPWKYVNVQVTYFDDGGFGTRPPLDSIAGGTLLSTATVANEVVIVGTPPNTNVFGVWVTRQTIWLLRPCPASETVVLTADSQKDALIDQFIVDTRCGDNGDGDVPAFRPCWRDGTGATFQHWLFGVPDNPTAPELVSNPHGTPQARVAVGPFSSGYIVDDPFLGCRQGIWNLDNGGTMTLTIPNDPAAPSGTYKYVRVQATQYRDAAVFTANAAVTIAGATLVSQQEQTLETTPFGARWIVHQTVWRLPNCPSSESVVLTGPANGSLIDQVVVDTLCLNPSCPGNLGPFNAESGECSALVTLPTASVDGCRVASVVCRAGGVVIGNPNRFSVGTTLVTCTVIDGEGQSTTCNFTVKVADNQPPTLTCPGDMTVARDPALCGANVTFTATASDNCPGTTVTCAPANGSVFPLGLTTVTCTAQDVSGNTSAACTFRVRVVDFTGDVAAFRPCWRGLPGSTYQNWAFAVSNNPAAPELVNNPFGAPRADFMVGFFSSGFIDNDPFLGCRQGIWNLDNLGTITLTIPNAPAAPPTAYKYVRLQATQYRDNAVFTANAAVTLTGATLVSQQEQTVETTLFGARWIVQQTIWRLPNCPVSESIVMTGPINGSLIDQVVVDTYCVTPPVCSTNITGVADTGQCGKAGVTWVSPVPDGCTVLSVICQTNGVPATSPGTFPVGVTPVACVVTDLDGGTFNCNFTVTITDTQPPIAQCRDITVTLDGLGQAVIAATQVDNGSSDNCGIASSSVVPNSFTCANVGANTVTLTVTDSSGSNATCTATVTVIDSTIPQIACPANVVTNTTGACSQVASWPAPVASDNCAVTNVTCSPAGGSVFAVGTTMVTCTALDSSGNPASCTFTVTVNDAEPPTIACPANVVTNTTGACSQVANWDAPVAADNCAVTNVTCSPASGSTFAVGTTTVSCTALDSSGNPASCTFTVTVNDAEPPTIACPANVVTNTTGACSQVASWPAPAAADNCAVTNVTCSPASGSIFAAGTTTVSCTALDSSGNPASCTFTVTVNDAELPAITSCASPTNALASANCQVAVPDFTAGVTASDNCDPTLTVTQSPAAGTLVGPGTNVITLTVTDDSGNSANCTTTFTVRSVADLSVQVISSPEPVTVGQPVSYTVTVANLGPCPASGVTVNNVLSTGQVLVSVTDPGTTTARACPTPGPSAWYRAENNAADSVGVNNGTLNGGVSFGPQAVAQGFIFDGLTGYISVPDAPALRPASLTIEGWIKIGDPNGLHVLLAKPQGSGLADSYSLWIASGVLHAAVSDGTGSGPFLTYPNFPTSSIFLFSDITGFPSLANKLKTPVDLVSQYLNSQLSAETLPLLAAYAGGPDAPLQGHIVADFNRIIQNGPLYTVPRFAGVTLSAETLYVLGRNPTGIDLVRLNRLLIRDAYPAEIVTELFPQLSQRYHIAYTLDSATHEQALYVNGDLVDSSLVTKTITYTSRPLVIGAGENAGSAADYFYKGEIDELAIYNRALSGIEVQGIHSAGANGRCFNNGAVVLGSLASGASQTFTVVAVPTTCPTASLQATVSGAETDPVLANNTATATATVAELAADQLRLSIRRVSPNNDHVEISWPTTCATYTLETTDDLSPVPILWTPASVPVLILQGRYSTVIPANEAHRFFRLKSQ